MSEAEAALYVARLALARREWLDNSEMGPYCAGCNGIPETGHDAECDLLLGMGWDDKNWSARIERFGREIRSAVRYGQRAAGGVSIDWEVIETALRARPTMCCIELCKIRDKYSLEPFSRFTNKPQIGETVWVAGTHGHEGVLNDGEVLAWAPDMRGLLDIFVSLR